MKKIEVKQICLWSALVGRSGHLKNSCIHFKLILYEFWPNNSSQTKSNQNRMKNAEVAKIRQWSALVGQLGRSKNSRGHLKLILCCSLPDVIPHIKFHLIRMKNTDVQIFEILEIKNILKIRQNWTTAATGAFCMVSLNPELSKLFWSRMVLNLQISRQGKMVKPRYPVRLKKSD